MKKILILFVLLVQSLLATDILISGAASLKEYLNKNTSEYEKQNPNINFILNLGGSGTLKNQVEQGAPVDIVFLADRDMMIDLKNKKIILDEFPILENKLVLIKNIHNKNSKITLATGDPKYVPAGRYAEQALKKSPLDMDYSLIYLKDVRSVLNYVELGEVDYGIVYLTDTKFLKNSEVVKIFEKSTHDSIEYSIGVIADSKNKNECIQFLNFLKGKNWDE
ncbi:molybdate ABC transporter substrate-binding protein [Cetobacterium sp. 8H]|uniref:molybdate ABC transporter substrate-binding protein n=1 Tax=Cetobacterium sp. 8H TaxID=2759681 RepID=UPI00163D36B4|nr:molybdate ABC transporter substrate-binding protein [Cetobacterium sp. 8H]MBC2851347.1 molybdate ABC transporter substrate-binding protein [Cetobacterium sp. 8H]